MKNIRKKNDKIISKKADKKCLQGDNIFINIC
jgi:hypothetical protein